MLIILILSTAFMVYKGRDVVISYTFSRLLPLTDSTQIDYDQFRKEFNQTGNTVVLAAEDINVFKKENFKLWQELENNLDTINGLGGILSPTSAYNLERNDSLHKLQVVPFSKYINAGIGIDSLGKLYHSLPFYQNLLYSENGKSPLMLLHVNTDMLYNKNIMRIVESIKKVVHKFEEASGFKVHVSGLPYIRMANTKKVSRGIFISVGLALFVTILIMFLFLRSFKATLISIVVVVFGVCWSFGLQALFGFPMSMLTALIPSLIIVIGVPNCIFLINKYHSEYKYHGNRIRAIQKVIHRIGAATLLTNFTTALGFASLIFTSSTVLKEFGVVASINIMMVFVISIILIPIYYSYLNDPKERHYVHLDKKWVKRFTSTLIHTVQDRRPVVYIAVTLLALISVYGTTLMHTTGNLTEEYRESDPLTIDLRFLEQNFGGVVPLEIVIDTKHHNGAEKLSFIKKLNRLQNGLDTLPHISRSLSIADGVKFAKQAYYRGSPSFYKLPTNMESNFILSYIPRQKGGLNVLNSLVDSSGQKARVSIQVEDLVAKQSQELQSQIRNITNKIFDPNRYDITITGASVVFLRGTSYLIHNLVLSLILAICVIAIIMALLFRSAAMVLVSLIPNLLPLLMTAGIMGFFGIPLKPSTILVFSIAFGISVDDTIHFLAKYRQEWRANGRNIGKAVLVSIQETGVSMFYTSIVLFFGFSTFISSSFGGIVALGLLISITLIIAMLSNLILLPTLLMTLDRIATNKDFDHPFVSYSEGGNPDEEDEDENDKAATGTKNTPNPKK